jgi:hypothetical protein
MTTCHTESLADRFAPTARPGFRQCVDLAQTATPLQIGGELVRFTEHVKDFLTLDLFFMTRFS